MTSSGVYLRDIPTPTDPMHHCILCPAGADFPANTHYTQDCRRMSLSNRLTSIQCFIEVLYSMIPGTKLSGPIPTEVYDDRFKDMVMAYYQIKPTDMKELTLYENSPYCPSCAQDPTRESEANYHWEVFCDFNEVPEYAHLLLSLDRALRNRHIHPSDRHPDVIEDHIHVAERIFHLHESTSAAPAAPSRGVNLVDSDGDVHSRAACLHSNKECSYSINHRVDFDYCEQLFASMRPENCNIPINPLILQEVPPTEGTRHTVATSSPLPRQADENVDPKAFPTEDTGHKVATNSPPLVEAGENMYPNTSPTEGTEKAVATNSPLPRSHVPSPMARTKEGKLRTSPGDMKRHLLDGLSVPIRRLHQGASCLTSAGRQHSPIVTDKVLNIFWATGVSERGPDSNDNQMEDYCDRRIGNSNLGEPHRYGIALLDPYLRVVPPPPITIRPPD